MLRRESSEAQASLKSLHFSKEARSFKIEKKKKKKEDGILGLKSVIEDLE